MLSIWPPIIWIGLQAAGFAFNCTKGGVAILSQTIAMVLGFGLLWWGNFFAPLVQ